MREEFDRASVNPSGYVASIFPRDIANALVKAFKSGDLAQIDTMTDRLAMLSFCRHRSSQSLRNGGVR